MSGKYFKKHTIMMISRKSVLIGLVATLSFLNSVAQEHITGRVTNESGDPLISASVAVLNARDSSMLHTAVTDTLGFFDIKSNNSEAFLLKVTYIGYYPYLRLHTSNRVGDITLKENSEVLNELVVKPEEMERFASHNSYRLDPDKSKNYATFLESLALIPELTVTGWRTLVASDGGSVLVLLNGVRVDEKELLVLDKGDVDKIEVYRNPPARFASMGASLVINIITLKNLRGGSVSADLTDAISPLDGNNIISAAYNINNWRFTAMYDDDMNGGQYRIDERISYDFKGKKYEKQKIGIDSPWRKLHHNFKLGLMKLWDNDLQLNATTTFTIHDEKADYRQKVISPEVSELTAYSPSHTKWKSYAFDIYLAKKTDRIHEFLFDLTGNLYVSNLRSSYFEENETGGRVFDETSEVDGTKKSLTGDLQYSRFWDNVTLKAGIRDNISLNNQSFQAGKVTNTIHSTSALNTFDLYSDVSTKFDKLELSGSLGLRQVNFRSPELDQVFSFFTIKPRLDVSYYPNNSLYFFLTYSADNLTPSISMLTETPILKDYKYAFVGNSGLKPYLQHSIWLGGSYNSKYLKAMLNFRYTYSKDGFTTFFEEREDFIAETYKNLSALSDFLIYWNFTYKPLGDPKLSISTFGNYLRGHIFYNGDKWSNDYLRYWFQIAYNVKHWSAMAMYQSSSNFMQGQWLIKAPTATVAEVNYKTDFGLNFGIGGRYLFVKEYLEGSKTHPDAIIYIDRWNISKQTANTIYLKLSYNFSFGKKLESRRQKLTNTDSDTGLLAR